MKKGRPGILLSVICNKNNLEKVSNLILNYTTTIGIRYYPIDRIELEREVKKIKTELGFFNVKISKTPDGKEKVKPESEEILKYASANNISPDAVSKVILDTYQNKK